jgi:hypothetical protein
MTFSSFSKGIIIEHDSSCWLVVKPGKTAGEIEVISTIVEINDPIRAIRVRYGDGVILESVISGKAFLRQTVKIGKTMFFPKKIVTNYFLKTKKVENNKIELEVGTTTKEFFSWEILCASIAIVSLGVIMVFFVNQITTNYLDNLLLLSLALILTGTGSIGRIFLAPPSDSIAFLFFNFVAWALLTCYFVILFALILYLAVWLDQILFEPIIEKISDLKEILKETEGLRVATIIATIWPIFVGFSIIILGGAAGNFDQEFVGSVISWAAKLGSLSITLTLLTGLINLEIRVFKKR